MRFRLSNADMQTIMRGLDALDKKDEAGSAHAQMLYQTLWSKGFRPDDTNDKGMIYSIEEYA